MSRANPTPGEHDAYIEAFEIGYAEGIERGRALAEQDMAEAWATVAAAVRRMADVPTYAELRHRRGEAA